MCFLLHLHGMCEHPLHLAYVLESLSILLIDAKILYFPANKGVLISLIKMIPFFGI